MLFIRRKRHNIAVVFVQWMLDVDVQSSSSLSSSSCASMSHKRRTSIAKNAMQVWRCVITLNQIFHLLRLEHSETLMMATQYLTHYFYHLSINASPSHQLPPLALMCFYMAVKVHESAVIPLSRLTELYQRFFLPRTKTTSMMWPAWISRDTGKSLSWMCVMSWTGDCIHRRLWKSSSRSSRQNPS